ALVVGCAGEAGGVGRGVVGVVGAVCAKAGADINTALASNTCFNTIFLSYFRFVRILRRCPSACRSNGSFKQPTTFDMGPK
ncbi:MAG: hypothetical protein JWO16_967, partial [Sphingomonas bacterium]|nr:hypothetical protein [Sphingomonas bacterium]